MKKPRSYNEALQHPGIQSIDDERPWTDREPDGMWVDPPLFCYLNDGWSWNGLNHFGFSGLRELQQEFDYIINEKAGE